MRIREIYLDASECMLLASYMERERKAVIRKLEEAVWILSGDTRESEEYHLVLHVLRKLRQMTDVEYASLDLREYTIDQDEVLL